MSDAAKKDQKPVSDKLKKFLDRLFDLTISKKKKTAVVKK